MPHAASSDPYHRPQGGPARRAWRAPTMKAIVQDRYGSADVLRIEEIAVPVPADDEVLVRIHAASLNHADTALMRGEPFVLRLAFGVRGPKVRVRGLDLAGVVEVVGSRVTAFIPGDEVYAQIETGSFAEYAVVSERALAPKPANLSFSEAAAVPVAANTALQGLRDVGRLQAGQGVLINGASGGVGTFAVQIAKALGAEVTGVCSTRNVELVRSLGADHVVDYTQDDFTRSGRRFDLIFDLAGSRSLTACRRVLTEKGTLVLSGGGGRLFGPLGRILRALLLSPFVGQSLRPFIATPSVENLLTLKGLIESGKVAPSIETTYRLEETAAAVGHFLDRHARAKIAIVP